MTKRYAVIQTNADLEEIEVIYSGDEVIVAETLMYYYFINESAYNVDYMLVDRHDNNEVLAKAFTMKAIRNRNECAA